MHSILPLNYLSVFPTLPSLPLLFPFSYSFSLLSPFSPFLPAPLYSLPVLSLTLPSLLLLLLLCPSLPLSLLAFILFPTFPSLLSPLFSFHCLVFPFLDPLFPTFFFVSFPISHLPFPTPTTVLSIELLATSMLFILFSDVCVMLPVKFVSFLPYN